MTVSDWHTGSTMKNNVTKLGLIGKNILKSTSPRLHVFLGETLGMPCTYELLEAGDDFPEDFLQQRIARCASEGYAGTNVTFPFKQKALGFVDRKAQSAALVGATNTLVFRDNGITASNTDFSGFARAYRENFGQQPAGKVLMLGAGGVGRAIAFALTQLQLDTLYIFDTSTAQADDLVSSLQAAGAKAEVVTQERLVDTMRSCQGLVNATPIGHYKTPGQPFPEEGWAQQQWAFDAVYTPIETEFLLQAKQHDLSILTGFQLFFYQGIDAFELFMDTRVDAKAIQPAFIAHIGGI